jgi:hypothetical protein
MTAKKTYNGWPNYETWNVMLWMDNDEGMYRYYRLRVDQMRVLGANAKEICLEVMPEGKTPDGVNLHSSKIRWGAIARAMREN